MFRFLAAVTIFFSVLAPQSFARDARTALLAQIGDWQVIRYVLNSGKWSCQAINSRGVHTGGVMIYMMASGQSRGYLSYHNGFEMPYGSKAKLQIGNATFTLLVDDKENLRAHWPTSGRDLMNMERAMFNLPHQRETERCSSPTVMARPMGFRPPKWTGSSNWSTKPALKSSRKDRDALDLVALAA